VKRIYFIRHAKSSWEDIRLTDFERPINDRGRNDIIKMGSWFKQRLVDLDAVFSSPANRAIYTARAICKEIEYEVHNIIINNNIFEATKDDLIQIIKGLDNHLNNIIIFGHNPALTDVINYLEVNLSLKNLPTLGVCGMDLNIKKWDDIDFNTGKSILFMTPKMLFL